MFYLYVQLTFDLEIESFLPSNQFDHALAVQQLTGLYT